MNKVLFVLSYLFFCIYIKADSSVENYSLADWMGIFSERLSDKQLNKIIIPGSHDSGASGFDRKNKVVDLPGILGSLRNIVKWLPGEGVTARWSNTQDKTITDMLNVGG